VAAVATVVLMGTLARRYVFPEPGDTLVTIAERELPGADGAATLLTSWNLHLAVRRTQIGAPGALLCTDVVYVEAPRP
jgi:hypothetical protein